MQIEIERIKNIPNKDIKKRNLLNDLCEYSILLNKIIIPFASGEDRFYYHHFSSGINYGLVQWTWQLLNELDQEGKIEILGQYVHNIKISDSVLKEYKENHN